MNLINTFELSWWFTNTFWFLLCPQMYVDEEGMALDGYPLMMAKSNQLSAMYLGDYSWMKDPYNRKLPITLFTWIGTVINTLIGGLIWAAQFFYLIDIPATISIVLQLIGYYS